MNINRRVRYLKIKMKKYKQLENDINKNIKSLRKKCKHEKLDITWYGTATCKICGEEFDWYCPTSPTLECEYDNDHGEDCIYCGQPEERK